MDRIHIVRILLSIYAIHFMCRHLSRWSCNLNFPIKFNLYSYVKQAKRSNWVIQMLLFRAARRVVVAFAKTPKLQLKWNYNQVIVFICFSFHAVKIFNALIPFADHDVKKLTTSVNAIILGVPLPFVGVDGTSACSNLYLSDGLTKTHCPLKAGESYVYKNAFDVLSIYPTINALDVHWALTESNNKELACFELPAKITN